MSDRHRPFRAEQPLPPGHRLAGASRIGGVATWADERLGLGTAMKKNLRKVFPDHWSFMLGEIALWSFVVLLLTGVFLTLWFQPSMAEVTYEGSYDQLRGIHDVAGLRLHPGHLVRGPRRPADAPDAPLGGDDLHRRACSCT